MTGGDGRVTSGIGVLAGDGQRPAGALIRLVEGVGSELDVHTSSDHFRRRHPQTPGPVLHLPVLRWLKLYLKAHHDGIIIPSHRLGG